MLNLKTKWFSKWALKNKLDDVELKAALNDLRNNRNVANLGGNLYKIRVARENEGKSGGFRTLLAYRKDDRAIFIYGFAKNEKDNLDKDELAAFKKLAGDFTRLDIKEIKRQINMGNLCKLEDKHEKKNK